MILLDLILLHLWPKQVAEGIVKATAGEEGPCAVLLGGGLGPKGQMMVKEKKIGRKSGLKKKTVHAKRLEYEFVAIKVLMGLGSGSKFLVDSCLVGPGGGKNSTQEMMILDVVGLGGGKKIHPRLEIKKKKSKALGSTNLTRSTFKKKRRKAKKAPS